MRSFLVTTAIAILVLSGCTQSAQQLAQQPRLVLPQTSDTKFERDVLDSDKPVLVDFYADWCEACHKMEPAMRQIQQHYGNRIKIIRVDVDKNPTLVERYNITAIPHLMVFRNGDLTADILGATTADRLSNALDSSLASRGRDTL